MEKIWQVEFVPNQANPIKAEFKENTGYRLEIASPDVLGGVQPCEKTEEMTQPVGVDAYGALWTEGVDLSGYAQKTEIPIKVSQLENDKGYLTEHQDISGKLDASMLPTAINTALTQAKASGEFDGKDGRDGQDGYTPQKGVDYFDGNPGKDGIDGKDGVSVTHSWSGTTLIVTSASGTSSANLKGDKGEKGETGAQGEKGDTGPQGPKGDTGEQGLPGINGKDGKDGVDGKDGQDGYTPVKGKDYFDGEDGKDGYTPVKGVDYFDGDKGETGPQGNPGEDGFSPSAKVERTEIGARITITDKDGTTTADVLDGSGGSGGDPTAAVLYVEQALTEDQQAQARTNIGAISVEEVEAMLDIEEEFSVSGELVQLDLDIESGTALEVVSKIQRDANWEPSNELVLHQVSGNNFVDLTSYFGGVGTVFERNGLTATINDNSTVTIKGTNESTDWTNIINTYHWSGEESKKVYPADTYTIPSGFSLNVRAAHYPANDTIEGVGGNLSGTVTFPEPFRIIGMHYGVKPNGSIDVTVPIGLFHGNSIPEAGYEYKGNIYKVTFDNPIYEGEFNWSTGELKDFNGNTIAYYDTNDITKLEGTNYFWTGFGENVVSNKSENLDKVILRFDETAPEETVSSICDFMLVPTTPEAAYGLYFSPFLPGGSAEFTGHEVPILTTKGNLIVKDSEDNVKYSKYIEPIFNNRGVADVLTHKGIDKKWSKKFYLNKAPTSITHVPPPYVGMIDNYIFVWEFDESEFINSGIPAKVRDIAMASPCFINNDSSERKITGYSEIWNGTPYPAFFSYNVETGKYILSAKGIQGASIEQQLTGYSKVYFYYQLETSYELPFGFALGIDAGDKVSFEADLQDNQPYMDVLTTYQGSIEPTFTAFIPRNVKDAMNGMSNAARILNMDASSGGDATVQGYSWIGAGDGSTDYSTQIQAKLDELHTASNGGTIHLGPGTYPISKSLLVYNNTKIIGDGHTIIEQRTNNTHAIILNGSHITLRDLTIKLAGECTEVTACIYANCNNIEGGKRNELYPENRNVWYCSIDNVTLLGSYGFSWDANGAYVSEQALAYRGVGIQTASLYCNFCDFNNVACRNLYVGVHGGGGANVYNGLYVVDSRIAMYGGGGNNIINLTGHSYYSIKETGVVSGSDWVYYGVFSDANNISLTYYDSQYMANGVLYFDGASLNNHYLFFGQASMLSNIPGGSGITSPSFKRVEDYGRGNTEIQPYPEKFVGIGSTLHGLSGLPIWNTQFNPSIHNALSGAGIWGSITSNKNWTSSDGMELAEICRYPKELQSGHSLGLDSALCQSTPSKEDPIEILIDIHERPVKGLQGFWIQFDHKYVAADYEISCDTTNDGNFDTVLKTVAGNTETISHYIEYQSGLRRFYRIKISITKALQIPNFNYKDAAYTDYTIDYNPNGYIGIVNFGIPSGEAYGRAFLGECGGNLYGNVDMHQNTLKNLPTPVENGDAANKSYVMEIVEAAIKGLPVYDGTYREIYQGEVEDV